MMTRRTGEPDLPQFAIEAVHRGRDHLPDPIHDDRRSIHFC
jgi:hypothetical protein